MQYLASYYWQQEERPLTSLVLQQLVYRRKKVPVLFACLCTAEQEECGNDYFAKRLTEWFQSGGREALLANRDNEKGIKIMLQEVIGQMDKELAEYRIYQHHPSETIVSVVGILCMADYYLLFYRGNIKAYLLNCRFMQANCRQIVKPGSTGLQIVSGRMEQGIGLLLATGDYGKNLQEAQLRECLAVKTLKKTGTCKRHLQELGQVSAQNGGRHMGAVLLVTEV